MDVQLHFQTEANPIITTCPQGAPRFNQAVLLTKPGDDLSDNSRKIIKLSNDQMTWIGKSEQTKMQSFLGVLRDGSITLLPVLFQASLQQQITKQITDGLSKNTAQEEGLTHFEQQKLVAEEMGTSKSRRKMRALETNKVKEENITNADSTKEKFDAKKDEIELQIQAEKQQHQQQETQLKLDLLPEFQRGEKQLHLIYDIKSIISSDDLENLDIGRLQIYTTQGNQEAIKHYSSYIKELLSKVQFTKSNKQTLLKQIEYLELMLKFQNKHIISNRNINEVAIDMHIKNPFLVQSILEKFYQATNSNEITFSRTNFLKDKYFCYMIVLHLFIYKFKFDILPLSKQLKLNNKKIIAYAKECGCKVDNKQDEIIVELKMIK